MVAHRAENASLRLVASRYWRAPDKSRTLTQAALANSVDMKVPQTELRVTLATQSSPHGARAIATLREELNPPSIMPDGHLLRPGHHFSAHIETIPSDGKCNRLT